LEILITNIEVWMIKDVKLKGQNGKLLLIICVKTSRRSIEQAAYLNLVTFQCLTI